MGKFIIIVLDGFGIGYMNDVDQVRPEDKGSNTFKSIAQAFPNLKLPMLEQLGLMNVAGFNLDNMSKNANATVGRSELMHFGADTFWGHQEIMGSLPLKPKEEPLAPHFEKVYNSLMEHGYKVEQYTGKLGGRLIIVNDAVTVADNIECDPGLAINITSALDYIGFSEVVKIGKLVRGQVTASRVIAFGGRGVDINNILSAIEEKDNGYIGVNAPASGVYVNDYHCVHMGYGVDPKKQLPQILWSEKNIHTFLLGKVADIVENPIAGNNISIVPTDEVMQRTLELITANDDCFVCANIQETDLCGHRENVGNYLDILKKADSGINKIIQRLNDDDILLVMADHGNDPNIGHPHHTRETVPLLLYGKRLKSVDIGLRKSLSDVAATASEFFGVSKPENGESFLKLILL